MPDLGIGRVPQEERRDESKVQHGAATLLEDHDVPDVWCVVENMRRKDCARGEEVEVGAPETDDGINPREEHAVKGGDHACRPFRLRHDERVFC